MAIPKIKEQDIIAALKYIDENGVPFHNQSTKYELERPSLRRPTPMILPFTKRSKRKKEHLQRQSQKRQS